MDHALNKDFFRSILGRWAELSPKSFWGDVLDVRFKLIQMLKNRECGNTLDISANVGLVLAEANATGRTAFEYDPKYEGLIKKNFPDIRVVLGSSEKLPFSENEFDTVILAHSMPGWDFSINSYENRDEEHARKNLIRSIHRILKPGGVFFLSTVNKNHFTYVNRNKGTLRQIQGYVDGLFEVVETIGWNPLPSIGSLFPKWLVRKIPRSLEPLIRIPGPKLYFGFPGIVGFLDRLSRNRSYEERGRHLLLVLRKK